MSPYADMFSSTLQNVVVALAGRPAPDTPLAASTIMPVGSTIPAEINGARVREDVVT